MRESLNIGVAQLHSAFDGFVCAEQCVAFIAEAIAAGVDLLVLPESASSRTDDPGQSPLAESLDGHFVTRLVAALQGSALTVVAGMTESSADLPYNTVVVIDAGGVRERYRKLHLYDAAGSKESETVRAGDVAPPIFEVMGFRVGLMTCYDIRFPETARVLAYQGADILAVPTSWVSGPLKELHWTTFCTARALESTSYVAASGQTGGTRIGRSTIIDPNGVAVAAAGSEPILLTATLTRACIDAARARFPLLDQRRFEIDPMPRGLPRPTQEAQ